MLHFWEFHQPATGNGRRHTLALLCRCHSVSESGDNQHRAHDLGRVRQRRRIVSLLRLQDAVKVAANATEFRAQIERAQVAWSTDDDEPLHLGLGSRR